MRLILAAGAAASLLLAGCRDQAETPAEPAPAETNGARAGAEVPPDLNAFAPRRAAVTASSGGEYVALAGAVDRFEIESARLAAGKAQSEGVRQFAAMLLRDHQRSAARLVAAGRAASPPLRAAPALNEGQRADLAALRAATPTAFDALYIDQQLRTHEQALTLFADYATAGDVPALRDHAAEAIAPIQQHLSQVRTLAEGAAAPAR